MELARVIEEVCELANAVPQKPRVGRVVNLGGPVPHPKFQGANSTEN